MKPIKLAVLHGMPALPLLMQLLREAQKNPNRAVQVSWTVSEGSSDFFTLSCSTSSQASLLRRDRGPVIPDWTLVRGGEYDGEQSSTAPTLLWTDSTNDMDTVLNKLQEFTQNKRPEHPEPPPAAPTKTQAPAAEREVAVATGSGDAAAEWAKAELEVARQRQTAPSASRSDPVTGQVTLAGDLTIVELSNVLQSINLCKMTGRLNLYNKTVQAEVYFNSGLLLHAAAHNSVSGSNLDLPSEQLLLELLLWDEGTFRFQPGASTAVQTVNRRMESFLLEGASLQDYAKAIRDRGFREDAMLVTAEGLSAERVEELMSNGVPADLTLQRKLYGKVQSGVRASDLIGDLPRSTWLPVMFNLFSSGLVKIGSERAVAKAQFDPALISKAYANKAFAGFARKESGVVDLPIMLYFLEQEFARHEKTKHPMSLVLFDLQPKGTASLSKADIDAVFRCLNEMKESFDILGHFEPEENKRFALLLPYRRLPAAFLFIDQLVFDLRGSGLLSRIDVHFGIAAVPGDANDARGLITAATHALAQGHETNRPIATHHGIENDPWETLRQKGDLAIMHEKLEEAGEIWMAALSEAEQFDPGDPRLLLTLDRLSGIYLARDKFEMAEPLLKLALDLRTQAGLDSDILINLDQMAKCFYEQKKFEDAESTMHQSIELAKTLFGPEHNAVANSYHNLATLYHVQNLYEEARHAYEKALYIKTKLHGKDHPETAKIQQNYEKLEKRKRQHGDASKHSQQQQQDSFISGSWKILTLDRSVRFDS